MVHHFLRTNPYKMSFFQRSVTCSFFFRNCTDVLIDKNSGGKVWDMFLVKIASKGTFLTTLMIIYLTKTFQMLIPRKLYNIILNWKKHMREEYMSYLWRMRKKKHSTSWYKGGHVLSQGRVTLYLPNHVKFVFGKKSCLCVVFVIRSKLMC